MWVENWYGKLLIISSYKRYRNSILTEEKEANSKKWPKNAYYQNILIIICKNTFSSPHKYWATFCQGRNEVKARQGIDTLDTIRTNDNSFIWVEMRLKPDRALTHSMLLIVSLFVFCRNEVKARQGIDTHILQRCHILQHLRRNEVKARQGIDTPF